MPKLLLDSGTDVLDLNEILEKGVGFQAKSNATGLGLPPVSVQWLEGAGDGATFRRKRVLTRDIDIPLEVLANDRAHLQALLSRLALALAGGCNLVFQEDDGIRWSVFVHRTGGGDYVYGDDTVGEREFQTVITFRAGDPYWTSSESQTRTIGGDIGVAPFLDGLVSMKVSSSQAIGEMTLINSGDTDAYPVWEVYGPGTNFEAVSPTGQKLRWTGALSAGQKLTLDARNGTVVDQMGANRYAELSAAPRFWTIKPGTSTAVASLSGISASSKIVCSWRPRKWMVV